MRIRQGQQVVFPVTFNSNPFLDYGKDYVDIEEITCNLKKRPEEDADNEHLQVLLSTGEIVIDESNHTFNVVFSQAKTKEVQKGTYLIVFAVKLSGIQYMIEYDIGDSKMTVRADRNRA